MPQAKQGGRLVDGVAVLGSKVGGTGFENEQMGQIQVAFTGFGFGDDLLGDADCGSGEEDMAEGWETDALAASLFDLPAPPFAGFGHSVIFGEDFRNPAYAEASKQLHLQAIRRGAYVLGTPRGQSPSTRCQPSISEGCRRQRSISGGTSGTRGHSGSLGFCISWGIRGSEDQRSTKVGCGGRYPSYSPTASWANSRASSGSKRGRRAVVRSKDLKNI